MDNYPNPWKTLSETPIYDNPWINVCEHKVINPAGGDGIYGVVTFKNVAVGIVPIDDDGNTWLVGQWRYALEEYSWEIPEGGSPAGEDPLTCAKRELKEETGLIAKNYMPLLKIHPSNSVCNEEGHIFIARGLSQSDTEHEDTEDITIKKLPLQDAIQMALDGKITDSLSLAALLKIAVLQAQNKI
ncbi:MAG: NUDIX domain-containing protein [Pontibacterium sp.]